MNKDAAFYLRRYSSRFRIRSYLCNNGIKFEDVVLRRTDGQNYERGSSHESIQVSIIMDRGMRQTREKILCSIVVIS